MNRNRKLIETLLHRARLQGEIAEAEMVAALKYLEDLNEEIENLKYEVLEANER